MRETDLPTDRDEWEAAIAHNAMERDALWISRRLDTTLDYLLGEHSQLHPMFGGVPNIRDLCFTVFMRAKNEGTDWFNDMLPTVEAGIEKMRRFADRPEPSR